MYPAGHLFGRELAKEGLLPSECVDVKLLIPADGVMRLRYTVNIRNEDLPKLVRALAAVAEQAGEEP